MSTKLSFAERAARSSEHPLAAYLYRLVAIKKTNLCVSADVNSTSALLRLAEEVGDCICVLKTHADIIDDFGERTIKGLIDISRRKHFLIFEDRKFGDIGSTVQAQYTRGPLNIASWAHLVNAHAFPGPAVVVALQAGAEAAMKKLTGGVSTEIYVGTPEVSEDEDSDSDSDAPPHPQPSPDAEVASVRSKKSSVMTTTTIYQTFDGGQSPRSSTDDDLEADRLDALRRLGDPPRSRGMLLFAQMSSEGNLMDARYTARCQEIAREHKDFVVGFIAQKSLNEKKGDNFLCLTPGVKLPPAGAEGKKVAGDGLGQQYRSPEQVVLKDGCDIVIVGRGILAANNRRNEAERYQAAAWKAYEARMGKS